MITERHGIRSRWRVALAAAPTTLLLTCCAGTATHSVALSLPPASAEPVPASESPDFADVDAALAVLQNDASFVTATKAGQALVELQSLIAEGNRLRHMLHTLRDDFPLDCAAITKIGQQAAAQAPRARLIVQQLPQEVALLWTAVGPTASRVADFERRVSALAAKLNSSSWLSTDALIGYTTVAQALELNLNGARESIIEIPAELAKLGTSVDSLTAAELSAARMCG